MILSTIHSLSLQTRQSLRQCGYIITQVTAAPKLPYLHEWACHCGSEILRGQNLLPGLSNYTVSCTTAVPSSLFPNTWLPLLFHIACLWDNRGEQRGVLPSLVSFSLPPCSGDKAMFYSSTRESLRKDKFPNLIDSSVHRQCRHTKSVKIYCNYATNELALGVSLFYMVKSEFNFYAIVMRQDSALSCHKVRQVSSSCTMKSP